MNSGLSVATSSDALRDAAKLIIRWSFEQPNAHVDELESERNISGLLNDAAAEIDRLRKWEAEVIAALEGLPDNTAPDAIRVLREQVNR